MAIQKVVLIFAMFFCTNSYADIYKCTDAKGIVTYSSSECKNNSTQSVNMSEKVAKATQKSRTAWFEDAELQNEKPVPLNVEMQKNIPTHLNVELPKKVSTSSNQKQTYHCDGRTRCSQMTSCEEAMFFLKDCPDTKMDGDFDGIPCEDQWCP